MKLNHVYEKVNIHLKKNDNIIFFYTNSNKLLLKCVPLVKAVCVLFHHINKELKFNLMALNLSRRMKKKLYIMPKFYFSHRQLNTLAKAISF